MPKTLNITKQMAVDYETQSISVSILRDSQECVPTLIERTLESRVSQSSSLEFRVRISISSRIRDTEKVALSLTTNRSHLVVDFNTVGCTLPADSCTATQVTIRLLRNITS